MTKAGIGLKARPGPDEEMLSAAELFQRRKRRILSGDEKMKSESRPTILSLAVHVSLLILLFGSLAALRKAFSHSSTILTTPINPPPPPVSSLHGRIRSPSFNKMPHSPRFYRGTSEGGERREHHATAPAFEEEGGGSQVWVIIGGELISAAADEGEKGGAEQGGGSLSILSVDLGDVASKIEEFSTQALIDEEDDEVEEGGGQKEGTSKGSSTTSPSTKGKKVKALMTCPWHANVVYIITEEEGQGGYGGQIVALQMNRETGEVIAVGETQASSSGEKLNALAMDPTGSYLLALSQSSNLIHAYAVDGQGHFNTSTPTATRRLAKGSTNLYTSVLPGGNVAVFVTYQSLEQIQQFTLDLATGQMKTTFPANIRLSQGIGPVSMALTQTGTKAYVLTTGATPRIVPMLVRPDGTLIYSSQSPLGALPSAVEAQVLAGTLMASPVQLLLHPQGSYLLALTTVASTITTTTDHSPSSSSSNSSSSSGYIGIITLDPQQGKMLSISHVEVGVKPGMLGFSPDGDYVFVLGHSREVIQNVYLYKVDVAADSLVLTTSFEMGEQTVESLVILPVLQKQEEEVQEKEEKGKEVLDAANAVLEMVDEKEAGKEEEDEQQKKGIGRDSALAVEKKRDSRSNSSKNAVRKVDSNSMSRDGRLHRKKAGSPH